MLIASQNSFSENGSPESEAGKSRAEDLDLADKATTGDRDAFETIYRKYQDRIYGLCLRLTTDRVEAEELVQETFVKAWLSMSGFSGRGQLGGWLARIAVNRWRDRWRSRHRTNLALQEFGREAGVAETDETNQASARSLTGDEAVIPLLTAMDLERCIAKLPLGARTVFVLHEIEGYPHHEIAQQMQLATGTVKAQLHRARKLLKVMLTDSKEQTHEA
ncbi:MAG: RNA polymerase sigma factor [Gemmatimonadales bacterium]|nr:RNA polymerase sigma factor [Gemmatimonadales bacterium]